MNVKAYKNYEIELRTSNSLLEKFIISGNSNKVKHELNSLLRKLQFTANERKEVLSLFAVIVQKYKIVSIDDLQSEKLATSTAKKAIIIVKTKLVRADKIDIHRKNKHGEYTEVKRIKERALIRKVNQRRLESAMLRIKNGFNALKSSKIESNILLKALYDSTVEIINPLDDSFIESGAANAIVIDDDVVIELDNFLIRGKLSQVNEESYAYRIALCINYYDVLIKDTHKKFLDLIELSEVSRDIDDYCLCDDYIEMLEKLGNELSKKLKGIEC